jgi:hypothetical protein
MMCGETRRSGLRRRLSFDLLAVVRVVDEVPQVELVDFAQALRLQNAEVVLAVSFVEQRVTVRAVARLVLALVPDHVVFAAVETVAFAIAAESVRPNERTYLDGGLLAQTNELDERWIVHDVLGQTPGVERRTASIQAVVELALLAVRATLEDVVVAGVGLQVELLALVVGALCFHLLVGTLGDLLKVVVC